MLQTFKIRNFGQIGLNTDMDPVDLPANAITNGYNFRLKNNQVYSVVAHETVSTPTGFNAGYILGVRTSSDLFTLVAGRTKIEVFDGAVWTDLTSAAGYAGLGADDELLWNGCLLGNIPIFNNFQHVPEYWSPQATTQIMQPLKFDAGNTWAAKNYSAKVVRSHGQYLFALNLREGATYLPDSYRWSHPADVNGLPFTWDETDLSAVAGKASVGGNSGALVDGLSLRDSFILYSEKAINALTPSGDEFVWHRTNITEEFGLAAAGAVVEHSAKHYFITNDDICVTNGVEVESIIKNRIRTTFQSRTSFQYIARSYAFKIAGESEIWFCVPSDGVTYASLAYVYNYKDDNWAIRNLPTGMAHAANVNLLSTPETWATIASTWSTVPTKWAWRPYADKTPMGVINSTSALVTLDDPSTTTMLNMVVERVGINISDSLITAETITATYLKFTGSSYMYLRIGSQDYEAAGVRWKNAQYLDVGATRMLQDNTTGVLHAFKFTGTPTNAIAFSGIDFLYVPNGLR